MLQPEKRPSNAITRVERVNNCLQLHSEAGCLRIAPKSGAIIQVVFAPADKITDAPGVGISDLPNIDTWEYEDDPKRVILKTAELLVYVSKLSGAIWYHNAHSGELLLAERDFEPRVLAPFDSYKTVESDSAETESIATADGVKQRIKKSEKVFDKQLFRTQLHLQWNREMLFGLGQSPEGTYQLRGTVQYVHQANMKIAMPFLVSTRGYGLLMGTGSPMLFHDNDYGSFLQTEADEQQCYYFIAGDYRQIIKGYRFLTGKASLLPRWAMGYMQSQERYENAEELVNTVKEYRRRGIPLDCIILDWLSWPDGQWGQKSFDAKRFPDPAKMMEEIHALDAKLMISIWPNMHNSSANFAEFKEAGLLFPFSDLYNAFDENARKLYWKQANEGIFQHGVDAWWCDSSEPITPEWFTPQEPEPSALYYQFIREAANFFPRELGNAFCLYHARALYEGQRGITEQKRVVNLTRSGYTGSQQYGTILWSGDTAASWETLEKQIVAGLQLCACGLPYWTMDIGAFFVKRGKPWYWNGNYEGTSDDLGYRELYVRWFQYGAFLPVFRAHGTDVRREVWAYGEPGEPFYDALVAAINLRYRLMPYIYSLMGAVWHDDATMIRFLAFDFPQDEKAALIANQYMFGDNLMVCPVTAPMLYEAESAPLQGVSQTRPVYLPKGCDWYDFYTNEKHAGGTWIDAPAPLERIPLFVRAGSIIPMANDDGTLTPQYYPGPQREFMLYEDDGDGYGYEKGAYKLTKLAHDADTDAIVFDVVHAGAMSKKSYEWAGVK